MKKDRSFVSSRWFQGLAGCALVMIAAVLAVANFHEGSTEPDRKAAVAPLRQVDAEEDGRLRTALMTADPVLRQRLLRQWADETALERMVFLLEQDPRASAFLRREMRLALLSSWVARDSRGAFAWAGGFAATDAAYGETRDLLVEAIRGLEPEPVLAEIGSTLPAGLRREVSVLYFRHWANEDPAAAAGELQKLVLGDAGNAALWEDLIPQVAAQWTGIEPERALAWIHGLPEGPVKANAEIQSAYRWTGLDPVAASRHAASQPSSRLSEVVAATWAERDPTAAVEWAGSLSGPSSRILSGALAVWAQSDPAAAAGYAATISQPEVRDEAFKSVVSSWAFSDPEAAADWLQRLPQSASKDLAAGHLCEALAPSQPERAFSLAAGIGDAEARGDRLTAIAGEWLKADPVTADQAIAGSSLDAGVKARLLAPGSP